MRVNELAEGDPPIMVGRLPVGWGLRLVLHDDDDDGHESWGVDLHIRTRNDEQPDCVASGTQKLPPHSSCAV